MTQDTSATHFRSLLASGRLLVAEGPIASVLYERGVWIKNAFEAMNVEAPHMVRDIHREYAAAGADILRTNTYNANPAALRRYGQAEEAEKFALVGLEIAQRIASEVGAHKNHPIFVAATIGPISTEDEANAETRAELYSRQAELFVGGGAQLLYFDNFPSLQELGIAVTAAHSLNPDKATIPALIATVAPLPEQEDIPEALDLDLLGFSGYSGPAALLEQTKANKKIAGQFFYLPSAGEPQMVDGRPIPMTTPEYLAVHVRRAIREGAAIVGGDSGTGLAHLKAVVGAVRSIQSGGALGNESENDSGAGSDTKPKAGSASALYKTVEVSEGERRELDPRLAPENQRSRLAAKLARGEFVVSVEIDPPPANTDPSGVLRKGRLLAESGLVDCINIADGPRASARMDPASMGLLLQDDCGLEPIVHYCCRDRNILGLQNDLIGANAVGLYNTLCITGDPPKLGNYPHATAVYDVDAIGLARLANNLNNGLDIANNPIKGNTTHFIGVGANPQRDDLDLEVRRLEEKVAAGAEYVLTQPVYDVAIFERFYKRIEHFVAETNTKILLGILPLASYKNALFLHNNVPGMAIPEVYRERMRSCETKEAARDTGVAIAQEALMECKAMVHGTYIMPPFDSAKAALRVLEILK